MTGKTVAALAVGAALGLGMGSLVGGALSFVLTKKAEAEAHRGWDLVPVVVAAQAVAPGAEVTMEDITQRSIPEQLVTASVVKPDSASYVVKQQVLVPVAAGEPLRWGYFEVSKARGDDAPGKWLLEADERAACSSEVKARGLAPKATTPGAVREALRGGTR